jgi:hypothetical protein
MVTVSAVAGSYGGTLTFEVRDLLGREMTRQTVRAESGGRHVFTWNPAPDVPTGDYLAIVRSGKEILSAHITRTK